MADVWFDHLSVDSRTVVIVVVVVKLRPRLVIALAEVLDNIYLYDLFII